MTSRLSAIMLGFFVVPVTHAANFNTRGFEVTVEPVLAYEYFSKDVPSRQRGGILLYGARFTAGKPHFSLEGEYTTGNETSVYTSPTQQSVLTRKDQLRIGARATGELSKVFSSYLRLGGQASRILSTTTTALSSSTNESDWQYKPYLGAGLQVSFSGYLSAGIDASYVFYSLNDFTQNSVQLSTSVQLHFNSK